MDRHTFTGALTNKVITKTRVPPKVHHKLKVLMVPIALVPMVLIIPDMILTPHAMAAISTLDKVLP